MQRDMAACCSTSGTMKGSATFSSSNARSMPLSRFLAPSRFRFLDGALHQKGGAPAGRTILLPARASSSSSPGSSYDGEDELDSEMSAEFDRVGNPNKYRDLAKHLELMYQISGAAQGDRSSSKPSRCECCRGSGETECEFCHGTGSMTVGDMIYCSETGCSPCPVCKSTGSVRCGKCSGTGYRASWLGPATGSSTSA